MGADPATDLTAAAAAQLTTFFSTNAQGQAAIQALTIGSVAPAFGINPTDIIAVGTALATNPAFAGAVAATQPAVLSQTVATVAAGFTAAGTTFDDNASALYPVFGVNESVTSPNDGIIHAAAGYRRNDGTRSHFGTDVNLEYFATDNLTMYANASWLSQTSWIPGESNDDGLEFRNELQAPKFRARAGITYSGNSGLFTNIAYQHDDKIYGYEGVYTGWVPVKNLVDFSIGNRFDNFTLQLSATNLLNTPYRSFVNMPVIGRRVLLTARINL